MKLYCKRVHLPYLIVLITTALGAVLFAHSSLLSGDVSQMHIDSQVYIYAARQILKGKILYRDVFDHKGPVMYLYECTGVNFSGINFSGLWFTQLFIFIAGVSPLFIYWAQKESFASSILALLFMVSWIFRTKTIGDNLPEILALSFICLFFFLCLKINEHLKNDDRKYYLLTGICGMGLFLLKSNLVIVVLPCLLWVCISLYKQKKLTTFFTYSVWGCTILILPIAAYFAWHHALKEAFFACWTFNFSYLSDQKISATESIRQVFFRPVSYLLAFVMMAAVLKFIFYKNEKDVFSLLITSILISAFVLVGISGRGAESVHYAIPLAPLLAWLVIYISHHFNKFQMITLFCIALYFCKPILLHLFTKKTYGGIEPGIVQYIKHHKKANETLSVFGNHSSVYWQTAIECNTPYFYTYPITHNCNSGLTQKFLQAFSASKADWVVLETRYQFDTCILNILKEYTLMASTKDEQIFHLE